MKVDAVSQASAFASKVFPVPGGPYNKIPVKIMKYSKNILNHKSGF